MNILLVEDHKSYLEGVEAYLLSYYKEKVNIYTASNGAEALTVLNGHTIQLIITDLNLPIKNGFELIEATRNRFSEIPIIVLTMYYNKTIIDKLKLLDVNGYLTKNISLKEIPIAIDFVCNNKGTHITEELVNLYKEYDFEKSNVNYQSDHFAKKFSLSLRELEVVDLLIDNKSNNEISELMYISSETVKSHRKNIYLKLGVNNILDMYKILNSHSINKSNE